MDRATIIQKLTELADSVMAAKGKDYTAGNWETDPNYNFNEIAKLLQGAPINPYTVCMIYFLKHVFSLIKFCKTGTQEGGEGLEGRHVDALNYVRILWTLVEEAKKADEAEWEEVDPDTKSRYVVAEAGLGFAQDEAEVDLTSPDEVYRITGIDPRDLAEAINRKYANCNCPACRRSFERDSQAAQDWLDRVNEKFDNTQK